MGVFAQALITPSRSKKQKKPDGPSGTPVAAPIAQETQGQGAVDDFFSGTRKRRQIASTIQGGQVKKNTLG